MRSRTIHPCGVMALGIMLVLGLSTVAPAEAQAEWLFGTYEHTGSIDGFSFTCSEANISEPQDLLPPAALFMLDTSGSMRQNNNNLWEPSRNAINQATAVLEDEMYLGLGLFPAQLIPRWDPSYSASLDHFFSLNARDDIMSILNSISDSDLGGGGTPTGDADYVSREVIKSYPELAAGGVLITDGAPTRSPSGYTHRSWVLHQSCITKQEGVLQYVVGIGGTIDKNFNDIHAAAAGTGSCTGGDPCDDISNTNRTDCEGSEHVHTEEQLRDLLMEIGQEIACTFPIEDPNLAQWPDGVPNDPEAVLVEVYDVDQGWVSISHRDLDSNDSGWFYASSARKNVTLTPDLCAQVGPGGIERVSTQAACNCEAIIEEHPWCLVPAVINAACPAKAFVCNGNIPECTGDAVPQQDECPWENCPPLDEPELCHVDNDVLVNVQGQNISWGDSVGDGDLENETNRCKMGVLTCTAATGAECMPLSPMPELCDGLDNNCDGLIDNLSSGWTSVDAPDDAHIDGMSLDAYPDQSGAACNEQDVCICSADAETQHGGLQAVLDGGDVHDEFDAYVNDWVSSLDGGCECTPLMSR